MIKTLCMVFFCASCVLFCFLCGQRYAAKGRACLSHPCSPSNHQRQFKYSGLLSACCQIFFFFIWHCGIYGNTIHATSLVTLFTLVTNLCISSSAPEPVQSQSSSCTSTTSQNRSVEPLRLTHLCLHLNLSLPVLRAPAKPSAVTPARAFLHHPFSWATFALSWCPHLGPTYKKKHKTKQNTNWFTLLDTAGSCFLWIALKNNHTPAPRSRQWQLLTTVAG